MKESQTMMIKILESWKSKLPAEPEREFPRRDGSGTIKFLALPERTVQMALCEAMDGTGCRAQVEFPLETPDLKPNQVVQIEVPDFPDVPLRSRRLTRIMEPSKQ